MNSPSAPMSTTGGSSPKIDSAQTPSPRRRLSRGAPPTPEQFLDELSLSAVGQPTGHAASRPTTAATEAADRQRVIFRTELLAAVRRHRRISAAPLPVTSKTLRRACTGYAHGRPTLPTERVVACLVEWMGRDVFSWLQRRAAIEALDDQPVPAGARLLPDPPTWPSPELLQEAPLG